MKGLIAIEAAIVMEGLIAIFTAIVTVIVTPIVTATGTAVSVLSCSSL